MTLHDKAWSPYAAGILIGLLQVPAYLLIEAALGTASSYVTIGAHIASLADASIGTMEYLAKHMYGAKNLWQVALVIGIAIGAFISMTLSGARRQAISPVWRRAVRIDKLSRRAPMAFAGGFIMVLGARIADGCTMGHGISGMAQLAGAGRHRQPDAAAHLPDGEGVPHGRRHRPHRTRRAERCLGREDAP